ncbi:MAG: response regulator, partial [Bacillota bacterium]|nr:response regulator [Bacillota bacterium]
MKREVIKILLVDDDEDDVVLIKEFIAEGLKGIKWEIQQATSVEGALEKILAEKYDICLVDYRLGEFDGLSLLQEIKYKGIEVPVVLLTGQGDEEIAVQAMKAGVSDYLLKSRLTPELLTSSIRYTVELYKREMLRKQAEEGLRKLSRAVEQS